MCEERHSTSPSDAACFSVVFPDVSATSSPSDAASASVVLSGGEDTLLTPNTETHTTAAEVSDPQQQLQLPHVTDFCY